MLGRDRELKQAKKLLEDNNNLVWLHGAPGEGKSLLAAEVVRTMWDQRQTTGGTFIVKLEGEPWEGHYDPPLIWASSEGFARSIWLAP